MNGGKICVSVCADSASEMIRLLKLAERDADIFEARFDCLSKDEFNYEYTVTASGVHRQIIDSIDSTKLLSTFRAKEQGGNRFLSNVERENFWNSGFETGYADCEEDVIDSAVKNSTVNAFRGMSICSHHDFSGIPEDLDEIYERLRDTNADIIKIAVTAHDAPDGIGVLRLIEKAKADGRGIIPIAMSEAGIWTRILGLLRGAFLTYVSLDPRSNTAPGQVTIKESSELYRIKDLDAETKVFGILGNPVSQSLSRFMHNRAFVSGGFNGVFIPFLVRDIDSFMRRMVRPETREIELNFGGFSVTMPHKQSILRHLDEIDETAAKIGAVNTVKISDDGKLIGINTDAHGFITPLKARYGDLRGANIAVFGAGGASRACIYALQIEGASVELFARDIAKAGPLANEFGVPLYPISGHKTLADFDILVDATPIGMAGELEDETLFTTDELKGVKFVYDLVTKPYDTPIIREANKAGVPALGGLEMLVAQGAKQFEIWTGESAPVEQMKESLRKRFAELNQ